MVGGYLGGASFYKFGGDPLYLHSPSLSLSLFHVFHVFHVLFLVLTPFASGQELATIMAPHGCGSGGSQVGGISTLYDLEWERGQTRTGRFVEVHGRLWKVQFIARRIMSLKVRRSENLLGHRSNTPSRARSNTGDGEVGDHNYLPRMG